MITKLTTKLQKARQCGIAEKINREEQSRLDNPEIDLMYGQLILEKGTKAIQWRKNSLFDNGAEKIGYPYGKKEGTEGGREEGKKRE